MAKFLFRFLGRKSEGKSNIVFWCLALSLAFIIILTLLILFKIRPGSAPLTIHYNILIGVDEVNKGWHIYGLPLIALVVTAVNSVLISRFQRFEPLASDLLAVTSAVVSFMFLIAGVAISSFV